MHVGSYTLSNPFPSLRQNETRAADAFVSLTAGAVFMYRGGKRVAGLVTQERIELIERGRVPVVGVPLRPNQRPGNTPADVDPYNGSATETQATSKQPPEAFSGNNSTASGNSSTATENQAAPRAFLNRKFARELAGPLATVAAGIALFARGCKLVNS